MVRGRRLYALRGVIRQLPLAGRPEFTRLPLVAGAVAQRLQLLLGLGVVAEMVHHKVLRWGVFFAAPDHFYYRGFASFDISCSEISCRLRGPAADSQIEQTFSRGQSVPWIRVRLMVPWGASGIPIRRGDKWVHCIHPRLRRNLLKAGFTLAEHRVTVWTDARVNKVMGVTST